MLASKRTLLLLSYGTPAPAEQVAAELAARFGLKVSMEEMQLPELPRRDGQVNADLVLKEVERKVATSGCGTGLGIVTFDLFVPGMNFVFGLSSGAAAVISVFRLQSPDPETHRSRVLKEAIHELGHVWGLGHCTRTLCVMHFSNSLADTDAKGTEFCREHAARLEELASIKDLPSQL